MQATVSNHYPLVEQAYLVYYYSLYIVPVLLVIANLHQSYGWDGWHYYDNQHLDHCIRASICNWCNMWYVSGLWMNWTNSRHMHLYIYTWIVNFECGSIISHSEVHSIFIARFGSNSIGIYLVIWFHNLACFPMTNEANNGYICVAHKGH